MAAVAETFRFNYLPAVFNLTAVGLDQDRLRRRGARFIASGAQHDSEDPFTKNKSKQPSRMGRDVPSAIV